MHNPSFDEFYFFKDKKRHNVAEIQDLYTSNNGDISYYKGYIFCPECNQAELRFTHRTSSRRAFLSKLPSSQHKKECSYIYDYATKTELEVYVKSLRASQIKDRLESALNLLFPNKKTFSADRFLENDSNPFVLEKKHGVGSPSIKRSIPRKSLNSWFDWEMEHQIFIFYGKVKLHVEQIIGKTASNGAPLYKLIVKIKRNQDWIYRTKIYRGITKDAIDENQVYALAIFGHIEFHDKYPQIRTETFDSIFFRKMVEN